MTQRRIEIYTIDHSTLIIDDFLRLLKDNYIKMVVDVRSQPYSRFNPQFNRESLQHGLAYASIGYVYAGDSLGGRPKDASCYKDGVLPADDARVDYLKVVDYRQVMQREWYQRGIERLLELASQKLPAVMCSEEDPMHCHRHHLITQTLLKRGVPVWHIRADGRVEEARALEKVAAWQPHSPNLTP
jgi:uncharacterized protein (DUF488 family)